MLRTILALSTATTLVLGSATLLQAQNVAATIQGIVTDASVAPIPGATVVVRNVATGDTRELVTDEGGRYRAPLRPPGEYEIRASLTGFRTVERRGVGLAVGQDAVINLTLPLGAIAENIIVIGDAPRIELTTGTVSGLVSEREIRDLPLSAAMRSATRSSARDSPRSICPWSSRSASALSGSSSEQNVSTCSIARILPFPPAGLRSRASTLTGRR